MDKPGKDQGTGTEEERRLEEAKKAVDSLALSLGALGTGGTLFIVINLACGHWNMKPPSAGLAAAAALACAPFLALTLHRFMPDAAWTERAFMASAYACLAAAVTGYLGLTAAHVWRHGWSHLDCLAADAKWRERHSEVFGTVAAYRCGRGPCAPDGAADRSKIQVVVDVDPVPWSEPRSEPARAGCRTAIFRPAPGSGVPLVGARIAVPAEACGDEPQAMPSIWHPIH